MNIKQELRAEILKADCASHYIKMLERDQIPGRCHACEYYCHIDEWCNLHERVLGPEHYCASWQGREG